MKTALLCLALMSGICTADEVTVMQTPNNKVIAKTICLDGYLFAVAAHGGRYDSGRGVAITQVYKIDALTGSTKLAECKKEDADFYGN